MTIQGRIESEYIVAYKAKDTVRLAVLRHLKTAAKNRAVDVLRPLTDDDLLEIIARQRIKFSEQDALLAGVFERYRVDRCCMDQTGMGEKPVEDAKDAHGNLRVEGVLFTGPNKLTMATIGKESFEDRRIRIPLGDKVVRADLHKLQKLSGPTGAPRFVAESDAEGHADRAWACFLALYAAGQKNSLQTWQKLANG